jgi:hypothetical protein
MPSLRDPQQSRGRQRRRGTQGFTDGRWADEDYTQRPGCAWRTARKRSAAPRSTAQLGVGRGVGAIAVGAESGTVRRGAVEAWALIDMGRSILLLSRK